MPYIIGGLVFIVLIIIMWAIGVRNGIVRAEVKIDEALSGIDVALTKRYDVLTKMLDVTKAYAKHEADTLKGIVNLRKGMTMDERVQANAAMDEAMSKINVVMENYPELRSSENFKQLQVSITDVEEHLQASRRLYNGNVTIYNNMIVSFPQSMIASKMGKVKKDFFQAESVKRNDVKMEF